MSGPYLDDLIADMQLRNAYAYIIRLKTVNDRWYFQDMETTIDPHRIIWTKHMIQAFWFPDEQSVEEFKTDFITPRDVEILRIAKPGR